MTDRRILITKISTMKKISILNLVILLAIVLAFSSKNSFGQQTQYQFENLDANNISARINSNGNLFWDQQYSSLFEVPKGSGIKSLAVSCLWFGGINSDSDELHFAGERYRQNGIDFISGKINSPSINTLWKVNKSAISYHLAHYNDAGYSLAAQIKDWRGPFEDVNHNDIYEPLLGEYPKIIGDQAIFFVYNDSVKHTESGGLPLIIEIQAMAYSYSGQGLSPADSAHLVNTIFIHYNIINKSTNNYKNCYLGSFNDIDLGSGFDDYIGFDSTLNLFYGYNGDDMDETEMGMIGYGNMLPAQGIMFLNRDAYSFMYFNNAGTGLPATEEPVTALHYYNYMQAIWKDSTHLLYGGKGHYSSGNTTTTETNFMFSGDPVSGSGWTEASENNPPYDRRGFISTYIGNFNAGDNICLDIAFPFARSETPNDNLEPVTLLKARAAAIQNFYNQHSTDCQYHTLISNSTISGYVGENNTIAKSGVNNPIADVNVLLQQQISTWTTIAQTQTNTQGYFEFVNLLAGKYRVILDIVGLEMLNIVEIALADNDTVNTLEFEITEDGIITINNATSIDNYQFGNLQVFPNPTNGIITVVVGADNHPTIQNDATIYIYDIIGHCVAQFSSFGGVPERRGGQFSILNCQFSIDISHLQQGMYYLKIGNETVKIIKN